MLNVRRMLAAPRRVDARVEATLDAAIQALVDRSMKMRRSQPGEWLRAYDDLRPMRDELTRLEADIGPAAVPLVELLFLHSFPRGFALRSEGLLDDGRPLLRYAAVGAFELAGTERRVVCDLRITVAKATARSTRQEMQAFELSVWDVGELDDQATYDMAEHFERLYLELARPEVYELEASEGELARALWIGAPSREQGAPPDGWAEKIKAIGVSYGIDIEAHGRLTDSLRSHVVEQMEAVSWDLLLTWAPNVSTEMRQCIDTYCAAAGADRLIQISTIRFDKVREELRLQLLDAIRRLQPRSGSSDAVVPPGGVVYLQKRSTAGDHDVFDVRMSPCSHNDFRSAAHADKGFKGVARLYDQRPKAVYKCGFSKCQCWRANFE